MQSEFKLPRKGYCVPRQGTIQVTLLNPLGTVVRMFVVPYDYSDMPPTNVSFIRQRILARMLESSADMCPNANEFERLSRNEQMRLLRYAIHLRYVNDTCPLFLYAKNLIANVLFLSYTQIQDISFGSTISTHRRKDFSLTKTRL